MATQAIHDGGINVGTTHSFRTSCDDGAINDCGNIRGASAHIDYSRGMLIINRYSGANGSREPFFHHVDATDMRSFSRAQERSLLNLRHA
jgi:hypothetical protein